MNHWISQIDQTTQEFVKHFGTLTDEQLNYKPNPNSWSIAQNIDHLITINESYFPSLMSLRNGDYRLPFMAKIGFMVSLFGKMILKSVNPDRQKKITTFPIWEPQSSNISPDILEQFVQHQEILKAEIQASKSLLDEGAIIASPANKNIVYTLATAFEVIVTHEQRHLEQAKGVKALISSKELSA